MAIPIPNTGLLIASAYVPIQGLHIVAPGTTSPSWVRLSSGDYAPRRTKWIRQIIVHTTKGKWPQHVKRGAGPAGRDKIVADFWRGDPQHSAAQIVVDNDGTIACLTDLVRFAAYHATTSNDWSVGIEIYQEADGGIYEAALDATIKLVIELAFLLKIPLQTPSRAYSGTIIRRMIAGGPDMVGVFGHRDNAWDAKKKTSTRGRGDPGDEFYSRLVSAGAEPMDFDGLEDLRLWEPRQRFLVGLGERLTIDGIAGPSTYGAMMRRGFANGRDIDRAIAATCALRRHDV